MDKYIDYYNDSKKVTYHEQTDISNILKLRAVLKTLPDFRSEEHTSELQSFFSFSWMKILPLRTIP